jgi:hypothetical protein
LDFYIAQGCPDFASFQTKVSEVTDWETATEIIGDISRCVDAWKEVVMIVAAMGIFIDKVVRKNNIDLSLDYPIDKKVRGLIAREIIDAYGNTGRSNMVFSILDKKVLTKEQITKLFWQVLKK